MKLNNSKENVLAKRIKDFEDTIINLLKEFSAEQEKKFKDIKFQMEEVKFCLKKFQELNELLKYVITNVLYLLVFIS